MNRPLTENHRLKGPATRKHSAAKPDPVDRPALAGRLQ
jgi:hypothetical protein